MSSNTVSMTDQSIMPLPEAWLWAVLAIGEAAGAAVLAIYHHPEAWARTEKPDQSPLTAADLAAHCLITERLRTLTPDIPVLSEEGGIPPERRSWRQYWLVDPLDGTREFIARNPEFTVNIALVRDGEPVLGAVCIPAAGESYAAARGQGAWRLRAGRREPLKVRDAAAPWRILMSRSHRNAADEAMIQRLRARGCEIACAGSSLKMCRIAAGEADAYPRTGPTMEWDTAAAQAVLVEAGGSLVDWQGRVLTYNQRDTLENPGFLAVGDPLILDRCRRWALGESL